MIKKFSNWFDTLEEPYRFITFVYFVFGAFFPFSLALISYKANVMIWPLVFGALGIIHLVLFYTFAIYRATRK